VGVHVRCAGRSCPWQEATRLGKVSQVIGQGSFRVASHTYGQKHRGEKAPGVGQKGFHQCVEQRYNTPSQHVSRKMLLPHISRINDVSVPPAKCHALDLKPLAFKGKNFASHKAMANLRVLVNKVENAQEMSPYRLLPIGKRPRIIASVTSSPLIHEGGGHMTLFLRIKHEAFSPVPLQWRTCSYAPADGTIFSSDDHSNT
jgi:hypothetical protein